jgi:hypothetical protein
LRKPSASSPLSPLVLADAQLPFARNTDERVTHE